MSDTVGWLGEHRLGLGHQAGAGEHAALDVTSRAAHGRLLVAGVAGGAIGGRSRVGVRSVGGVIGGRNRLRSVRDGGVIGGRNRLRSVRDGGVIGGRSRLRSVRDGGVIGGRNRLRSVRDGGKCRGGGSEDAGVTVFVEGAHRNAELPSAGAAADPGSEQFGGLVGHLGVDDGTPTPPARLEKGVFAALSIAFDGACHGGARDVEGGHDVGLADAGNDVQPGDAQQHGAAVVGGMAIEGLEVEEVIGEAVAGLHGVAVADGSGVRKGEGQEEDHGGSNHVSLYSGILNDTMSSGNRPREQKGARKTGLLEHLEATGAAGQRTMSGSLKRTRISRPQGRWAPHDGEF